jgi:hypothetical protein
MSWGPDLRDVTDPARPDVQMRQGPADGSGARTVAYYGTEKIPVEERAAGRRDVTNPRREDKRRARAYTADAEDDLL